MDQYATVLSEQYNARAAQRLGLRAYDRDLAVGLLTNMNKDMTDFTNTFRALSAVGAGEEPESIPGPLQQVWPALQALWVIVGHSPRCTCAETPVGGQSGGCVSCSDSMFSLYRRHSRLVCQPSSMCWQHLQTGNAS